MPMGNPIADDIRFDGECKARLASLILVSLSILSSRSVYGQLQVGWIYDRGRLTSRLFPECGIKRIERRAVAHRARLASQHGT
jgi:hypothetical protein